MKRMHGSNTNMQGNTSNTNTEGKPAEKSSNANLANLGIRPHDFTGFKYGTTSYEVEVPEDTEKRNERRVRKWIGKIDNRKSEIITRI